MIGSKEVFESALDREGLETALQALLSSPTTGKKIQSLLDMKHKQSAE
jgi:hypothetical protein